MNAPTSFANRMRLAIKESGEPSLDAIAAAAGTSKGQVSQWQTEGKVQPENVKADVVERICGVLKIRPRWLLYGEPPMRPEVNGNISHYVNSTPSRFLRPDSAIVRQANDFLVVKFASFNDDKVAFDLDKHAELFALAYHWIADRTDNTVLNELIQAMNNATGGIVINGQSERANKTVRRKRTRK